MITSIIISHTHVLLQLCIVLPNGEHYYFGGTIQSWYMGAANSYTCCHQIYKLVPLLFTHVQPFHPTCSCAFYTCCIFLFKKNVNYSNESTHSISTHNVPKSLFIAAVYWFIYYFLFFIYGLRARDIMVHVIIDLPCVCIGAQHSHSTLELIYWCQSSLSLAYSKSSMPCFSFFVGVATVAAFFCLCPINAAS